MKHEAGSSTDHGGREAARRVSHVRYALRRPELRISDRIGPLPKLHGDILDPSNGKPCFGLICYPISRGRVIPKRTNPLKSAIRPLGLDHPFVAVTEYDVKERFFRALCHDGVRVTLVVWCSTPSILNTIWQRSRDPATSCAVGFGTRRREAAERAGS